MSEEQIEEFNQDSLNMVFCGTGSCKCPAINIHKDLDNVIIGGKDEGFTVFTKEQFKLFVKEIQFFFNLLLLHCQTFCQIVVSLRLTFSCPFSFTCTCMRF